ncbi:PREDICTED: F-box/FBD/LRR-repeat protein At2g26030-like isoform X2 [Camelina sativa]|uniref:F-box/FBD/LRR-repeat protein At2g26030-like isoform X2 n=1 Tax=Camelina sativa TaxID=90675 RepID=A0ABM1QEV7_CAMSA|nr:PREDICTED: F-box/FBD/LRR-repeat protein At2g26030-like isoform X2 [Camelina sativa]
MSCDRISELPDSLLTQVLSYLPTKDSVKTSVLSKRWELLWLSVPVLDLKVSDFPDEDYARFIDKFMDFNRNSRMQMFKIKYDDYTYDDDRLTGWVSTAVNRGIEHLDAKGFETDMCIREFMPLDIYKSNTLVSLVLVTVGIVNPEFVVSLPCLKILHLEDVWYFDDPLIMEKVISGCPVLEDLVLIRPFDFCDLDVLQFLRLRSLTLKRFRLTFEYSNGGTFYSVEIDAPRLEYLNFNDDNSDMVIVKNLTSLFMIDIDTEFNVKLGGSPLEPGDLSKRDTIRDFLTGVSCVRHMIISLRTLEVLYRYSKLGPIPRFDNLYRLQAAISGSLLQLLLVFLESCPNLENLILDFVVSTEPEQGGVDYVPQCLLSSLESVEIRELVIGEETGMKLVKYFLKNSVVLQRLTLHFKDSSIANQDSDIKKELHTFTKRSRNCEVIIH